MLAHGQSLYLFGGATTKHGPATRPGDLTTLGTLNDLWRYDLATSAWDCLEPDSDECGFQPGAARPSGRVLPAWTPVGGRFYLFGGLTILEVGWQTRLLNDLWAFDPQANEWELLEEDDERVMRSPDDVSGPRPMTLGGAGVATIGDRVYLMAGWGGKGEKVVLSGQLWCYGAASGEWDLLCDGSAAGQETPQERYCPGFVSWGNKLYLWGGRDTETRSPEFFNDFWQYDPERDEWLMVYDNRPEDDDCPCPRYGFGYERIGNYLHIFGGFASEKGNGPQLNDFWRCDLCSGEWECLEPHNGAKDYSASAQRPGVRRVPATGAIDNRFYMFGGLDLASGPDETAPTIAFNDLWCSARL